MWGCLSALHMPQPGEELLLLTWLEAVVRCESGVPSELRLVLVPNKLVFESDDVRPVAESNGEAVVDAAVVDATVSWSSSWWHRDCRGTDSSGLEAQRSSAATSSMEIVCR